jgi:molybdopterin-containing oxidoreductase family membrane subunit
MLFWTVQITGVLLPAILPMFKLFKKTGLLFILAVIVLIASWLKRYLIVIPVMENSLLPVQNLPMNFVFYKASTTEIIVSTGTIILLVIIISILTKIFPVVPISQTIEAQNENVTLSLKHTR